MYLSILSFLVAVNWAQRPFGFTLNKVIWREWTEEPGYDCNNRPVISGAMPIGNGDTVALVWPNTTFGSIEGYIRKQDAQASDTALFTIAHFKLQLEPNPFTSSAYFLQQLDLNTATVEIETDTLSAALRIEATLNQLHINISSQISLDATLKFLSVHPSTNFSWQDPWACSAIEITPDISLDPISAPFSPNYTIIMYHANPPASPTDYFDRILERQGLASIAPQLKNRWANLHYGVAVSSPAFERRDPATLVSSSTKSIELSIAVATHITNSLSDFLETLYKVQQAKPVESHFTWWKKFNNRSWILTPNTQDLTDMYAITRYVQAIQSRGLWPIKYNGEMFTANVPGQWTDYRDWGASNWWQNTRLPYHAMLISGDVDLMDTLFLYYGQMLPLARARTRKYFNHRGIFFTETKTLFGAFAERDYGCSRPATYPLWLETNPYIHLDYGGNAGGPGVSMMILRAYQYTQNETRLKRDLPIVLDTLWFFYEHYERQDGKLHIYPTQALETYWCEYPINETNCVVNDQPTVSSLYAMAQRVLNLPEKFISSSDREMVTDLLKILPPLPIQDGILAAAEYFPTERRNFETPELWPIHPNFMINVGINRTSNMASLFNSAVGAWESAGQRPYNRRPFGWNQYGMNAALLGQTEKSWQLVLNRLSGAQAKGYRFPGFAPHMQDYQPSSDHFANMMSALQYMLLQDGMNDEVVLFPAWPCNQDVEAKLYGSLQTVIELSLVNGKLRRFVVTPESRKSDVLFANCV